MIASGDDHRDPGSGKPLESGRGQVHSLDRRHCTVENIACDQYRIDLPDDRLIDQPVDEIALRLDEVNAMERATKMPVGRVKKPHNRTLTGTTDSEASTHRSEAGELRIDGSARPGYLNP